MNVFRVVGFSVVLLLLGCSGDDAVHVQSTCIINEADFSASCTQDNNPAEGTGGQGGIGGVGGDGGTGGSAASSAPECTSPTDCFVFSPFCHVPTCTEGTCGSSSMEDGTVCGFGTDWGTCIKGTCVVDCDDANECTLDYFGALGCSHLDDTSYPACGVAGTCFNEQCCEGCIDAQSASCVDACPSGAACASNGFCP